MTKESMMDRFRFNPSKGMEFGVYTLGDHMPNPLTKKTIPAHQRIKEIIELAKLAEQAGVDFFSVGESHQEFFTTQAHSVVLSAIAQATSTIKLGSSSTIISTLDPVRVFEDFATLDLISDGRIELVAGRASRLGNFELLGYNLNKYEEIFEEKLELLRLINDNEIVTWHGEFRESLKDAEILPRPKNGYLPIWRAVGGPPASAVKAGYTGIPMMLAILGGPVDYFKNTIDIYRESLEFANYNPAEFPITTAGLFYVADTLQQAQKEMYPFLSAGMKLSNGKEYPKWQFARGAERTNVLNIGSPESVVDKILYQHEMFNNQRYIGQMDFGGIPFDKLMKNIELIGEKVLPEIRKYTTKTEGTDKK